MIVQLVSFLSLLSATYALRSVCYYTNWAQYRNGKGQFYPEDTDPSLCTHIMYSFGKVTNLDIKPFEWNDDSTQWSKGMYERMMAVKAKNPGTKVLLAVGGWNMGTAEFTRIAASAQSRNTFATNAVNFLRKRDFDGLDMDWEYPGSRGSPPEDRRNFVETMGELRRVFELEAAQSGQTRLLLTGAFPAGKKTLEAGYNLPAVVPYMDFISIMTYDLHGSWEKTTGHNAPLKPHSSDTGDKAFLNVEWVANTYIQQGVPAAMINLGIPTYGRSFTLRNPSSHSLGSAATGPGQAGRYTREKGFVAYYEVCEMKQSGGQVYDIPGQHVRYLVSGDQWIGFDDVTSVKEKACFASSLGLGGIMFWALDTDDFKGSTCSEGKYPLISSAWTSFQNPSQCGATPGVVFPTNAPVYPTNAPVYPTNAPVYPTNAPVYPTNAPVYPVPTAPAINFDCRTRNDGLYADPTSCEHFVLCANQLAYRSKCGPSLKFNLKMGYCDFAQNVVCSNKIGSFIPVPGAKPTPRPTVSVGAKSCQSGAKFYRDPVMCSRFYQCFNGLAYAQDCPPPLVFNEQAELCDWSSNVPGC